MQQTQTYKLNLIDKNDTFSPDPLNDNAQKTEQALKNAAAALTAETNARAAADTAETNARKTADAAEESARKAADTAEASARQSADTAETNARISAVSALDQRLKVFEAHNLVTGIYTGTQDSDRTISVGFTPKFVFIAASHVDECPCLLLTENLPLYQRGGATVSEAAKIVAGGFQLYNITGTVNILDVRNQRYAYLAYA